MFKKCLYLVVSIVVLVAMVNGIFFVLRSYGIINENKLVTWSDKKEKGVDIKITVKRCSFYQGEKVNILDWVSVYDEKNNELQDVAKVYIDDINSEILDTSIPGVREVKVAATNPRSKKRATKEFYVLIDGRL